VFERVGGTRKTGLTGGLSRAPYARVWWGVREPFLPTEKNEFGIGGDAISRLPALFLVDLSRSQFLPIPNPFSLFLRKFGQITRPIFSKSGVHTPRPPVFCQWFIKNLLTYLLTWCFDYFHTKTKNWANQSLDNTCNSRVLIHRASKLLRVWLFVIFRVSFLVVTVGFLSNIRASCFAAFTPDGLICMTLQKAFTHCSLICIKWF